MRIVRRLDAKRMVLCLCLLGMLGLGSGCGDGSTTTAPPATPEQQERTDKLRNARKEALGVSGGKAIIEKKGQTKK
jgi:hypothetical protein